MAYFYGSKVNFIGGNGFSFGNFLVTIGDSKFILLKDLRLIIFVNEVKSNDPPAIIFVSNFEPTDVEISD
jgi:hypothetical protein